MVATTDYTGEEAAEATEDSLGEEGVAEVASIEATKRGLIPTRICV
jgi:hypothetical protein